MRGDLNDLKGPGFQFKSPWVERMFEIIKEISEYEIAGKELEVENMNTNRQNLICAVNLCHYFLTELDQESGEEMYTPSLET